MEEICKLIYFGCKFNTNMLSNKVLFKMSLKTAKFTYCQNCLDRSLSIDANADNFCLFLPYQRTNSFFLIK